MNFLNLPGLHLIYGPMFSGKTSELIRNLSIYSSMELNVLYVNCIKDNRTNEDFSSHNPNLRLPQNVTTIKVNKLVDLLTKLDIEKIDIIGIDEAQFFSDLHDVVLELIEKYKKRVIVVGLDSDYNRNKFGQILDLIPHL